MAVWAVLNAVSVGLELQPRAVLIPALPHQKAHCLDPHEPPFSAADKSDKAEGFSCIAVLIYTFSRGHRVVL